MASLRVALLLAIACLSLEQVNAQTKYKVCAALSKDSECQAVETDNSDVECAKVADSVDCLVRMSEDKADFVLLSAEETILAALSDKTDKFSVVASVRSRESDYERFAFQSVAVVPIGHQNGLQGLSQGKLCHPGLGKGKEQLWSDRVLKYFEKQVVASTKKCPSGTTSSADDDANDLNNFFSAACRPGPWVLDQDEDKKLKAKYPKLCSLCGDKDPNCEGYRYFEPRTESGAPVNSHMSAVACLVKAHGTVAYVAYNHVKEYFQGNMEEMKKFGLLCENGTVVPFTGQFPPTNPPCAWVQQPWPAIVARKAIAGDLIKDLKTWIPTGKPDELAGWKESLANILFNTHGDVVINYPFQTQSPTEYILEGRPLPKVDPTACRKAVKWCTVNERELNKCSWVQNSALTVGLSPDISCVQGTSHLDCLKQVQDKRADFLSIDTNLGYLARRSYELDPVLYGQTQSKYASRVLAVVKESSGILRWENLKGKSACFPEYGGIAWLAFIRAARERKVISTSECDYASVVAGFFSGACAPGARDPAHFPSKAVDPAVLCSACRGWQPRNPTGNEQGVVPPQTLPATPDQMQVCPADSTNPYYGTMGALKCLSEEHSNVAFLEGQYLTERARHLKLDPANYRVLCRNGSLAANTGFTVDENCALSVTIDSEIVARRDYENPLSLQLLIQELETWFGYTTNTVNLINLKIFSPFNNTKDLLFKDSTISVATRNSNNDYVKNYVELNKHNDQCSGVRSGAGVLVSVPALATLLMALAVKLMNY